MKHQVLFSLKDRSKQKIEVSSTAILLGSLRVNMSKKDDFGCLV